MPLIYSETNGLTGWVGWTVLTSHGLKIKNNS